MKSKDLIVVCICLITFFGYNLKAEIHYGILPTNADPQDAVAAWHEFKPMGLTSDYTPDPDTMLRQFWKGDTRGEYQAWALIMAVMFNDHETAKKLWNFTK